MLIALAAGQPLDCILQKTEVGDPLRAAAGVRIRSMEKGFLGTRILAGAPLADAHEFLADNAFAAAFA